MAESTPPSRASIDEEPSGEGGPSVEPSRPSSRFRDAPPSGDPRSRPLRLIDPPRASSPSLSSAAHPPSEPRPIPGRPGADAGPDRANLVQGRVQLIAALLLLLVLVVVPLYLWRRPRAAQTDEAKPAPSALAVMPTALASAEPPPHAKNGVTVADAKVIGCHDPGPTRTPSDQCDRVPSFEAAFSKAILDAASCFPPGTPSGQIAFVADASYARHKAPVRVHHHREDTTLPAKVVAACVADVRKALASAALDPAHAHSRYEIEIDATYGAKN